MLTADSAVSAGSKRMAKQAAQRRGNCSYQRATGRLFGEGCLAQKTSWRRVLYLPGRILGRNYTTSSRAHRAT